jgi:hypothetical protein
MNQLGVLIPILIFTIPIIAIWTSHQQKMEKLRSEGGSGLSNELAARQAQHTRELEERVRVLERIITDKGTDIASQIEALRDAPNAEAQSEMHEKEPR